MMRKSVLAVAVGAMLVSQGVHAQFSQQGSKLTGTGATGNAWQGNAVALSSDGNTAIVGGYLDNAGAGAAWIFGRSNGVWSQQGVKLVGTSATGPGSSSQGWAVAISGDGNTALVGGPADNTGRGAVWAFTRSGNAWAQQGTKFAGSGAVGAANQGWAVALSSDGNTALVGGPADNSGAGAVWVFTRTGGTWKQQGSKLVGTGAIGGLLAVSGGSGAYGSAAQGSSVALSSDGSTAVVGGMQDNSGYGAVWVFTQSSGKWTQQGYKLVGSSPNTFFTVTGNASVTATFAQQPVPCYSLATAISPHSKGTITVNTPQSCKGGYTPGTQISLEVVPQNSNWAIVGWSGSGGTFSALSSYSTTFTIAANATVTANLSAAGSDCETLAVAVEPAGAGLAAINTAANCETSASVEGFTQGTSLFVAAQPGPGFVFTGWTSLGGAFANASAPTTRFTIAASTTAIANFAPTPTGCYSLSAAAGPSGAGAVTTNTPQNCSGGYTPGTPVSLTANPAAGWTFSSWSGSGGSLLNPGGLAPSSANQGLSIAVSGDGNTLIFGGDVAGPSTGTVWVFSRSGTTWTQQGNPIVTSGIGGLSQQSWAVGLSTDGNTAVVAEPGDNTGMGAAWVFTRSGGVWTQQGNKVVGTGATGNAEQGYAAAISGDAGTIVIGGPTDSGGAGAAWAFTSAGTAPACTFALSPAFQGFSVPGGRGGFSVGLVTGGGCPWVAVSNNAWITVTGSQTGTDNGQVTFGVSGNTGVSRAGTISIAGQTFTVYQAGSNCSYSIDPTAGTFPGSGGGGSFTMTSSADCPWTATGNASWIHLANGGTGIGTGPVNFTLDANAGGPRAGTIAIEGLTFTVNQAPPLPVAAFTVNPASAVAGEVLSFAATSTGAPTSWSWNFGDGSGAATQNPAHVYSAAGTYAVVLTVGNQTGQGSTTQQIVVASGLARWVPVVSHGSGANGAEWRSDLSVLNPGAVAATVQGLFHTSGGEVPGTVVIPAGNEFVFQDVVGVLGSTGSGALEILSDQPVVVTSRTYDQQQAGTVGQDYASYAVADGLSAGQTAWLPQLTENAAYRSNISLTNTGGAPADVTVALLDGSGNPLGSYDVTLSPGDWAQQNRLFFGFAGQTALDVGYAVVSVNSGAGIVASAAVIDNVTNDPTTVPMTRASDVPGAGSVWVPSVSHAQGANGTAWRSDVGLLNPGATAANVQELLYTPGGVVTGTAVVPAGSQFVATDIVGQLGFNGSGALEIVSDQPLVVTSRTYDQLASGTVGQGYASYPTAAGIGAGQSAWLPQLAEDAEYRTNIALTNTGSATAAVTVTLYDGGGNALGSYGVTLTPGQWSQQNQPFVSKAGQSDLTAGYATVTVTSGSGVIASASVIDNVTNDPTTVAMAVQ